jgi:hypothetical protein
MQRRYEDIISLSFEVKAQLLYLLHSSTQMLDNKGDMVGQYVR